MAALTGGAGGIVQSGTSLSGSPAYFFSSGSHGNLGSTTSNETTNIPPAVGSWTTTIQPIEITGASGNVLEVPAQVALTAVLLCQGGTPDGAAEAGHQALNQLVQEQLQQFISGIDLVAIAAQIQQLMATTPGLTELAAAVQILNAQFAIVQQNISEFGPSVIEAAIVNHGGIALSTLLDGTDQPSGQFSNVYTQDQLAATSVENPIAFAPFLTGDTSPFPDWGFNLHGNAYQRISVWTTPLPDSVPPGRWEVSGVLKALVESGGVQWITHIGGQLTDGTPWILTRGHAVELITAGTNSFFVRGADQSQADVEVVAHDPRINHPYLKTVADQSLEDNLSQLPPCASFLTHQVNV